MSRRSSESIQAEIRIEEEYKKTLELRKRAQEARKEFEIQVIISDFQIWSY